MPEIYLDNAAATPIQTAVMRVMVRVSREAGNPSSFNDAGRRARDVLAKAREDVAGFLSARADEIIFCASGSEANTLAIQGIVKATPSRSHIVSTAIEHPSVLAAIRDSSASRTLVQPNEEGIVSVDDVVAAIKSNTVLVSVMYANNEVGSIQPIKQIAKAIRDYRRTNHTDFPYLHIDACQAAAWLPMDVQALGVDLLTLNGAKVHGPRGIAALYARRGVPLFPIISGGNQELGRRAGTEDLAGAAGLAQAVKLIRKNVIERVQGMRDSFCAALAEKLPEVRINGPKGPDALPSIINISIPDCSSEELLLELDQLSIRAGAGSACTAHRVEPSHVLVAMRVPKPYLEGALRLSMSRASKKQDLEKVVAVLPQVIETVRTRRNS